MGWWKSEHGLIGDSPADVLDDAFAKIEKVYRKQSGRPPLHGEIADLIEFCSCGTFKVSCGDARAHWSRRALLDGKVPGARPSAANRANVEPRERPAR